MFKKKSKVLFAAALLSTLYVIYLLVYFGGHLDTSDEVELVAGAIASAIVAPHIFFIVLGSIFNWIGFFTRKPWAALVGAIFYCVAAGVLLLYIVNTAPLIILGFIGYSNQKKLNEIEDNEPEIDESAKKTEEVQDNSMSKVNLVFSWIISVFLFVFGFICLEEYFSTGVMLIVGSLIFIPPLTIKIFPNKNIPLWRKILAAIIIFVAAITVGIFEEDRLNNVNNNYSSAFPQDDNQSIIHEEDNDNTTTRTTSTTKPQNQSTKAPETVSQSNAVRSAKNYINVMPFSKLGLISQLEYEGYSNADATYAVGKISVNWNEQALKKAKNYLDTMPFSRQGLIDQLKYEKFTNSEAVYGTDQTNTNWNNQAAKKVQDYLDIMPFSRQGLIDQLKYEGYTNSQAIYGVDSVGL